MLEILKKYFLSLFLLLRCNQGTDVVAMDPMNTDTDADLDYNIPEIWEKRMRLDASRKSCFGAMSGSEFSEQPIIEKDQFVNEPGDVIHVNVMTELYGPAVTGETTLRGKEDKLSTGQFNITVDWLRKAVATTKKVKKAVNFDVFQQVRIRLTNWWAREKDRLIFAQLLDNTTNTLYAGNATSSATLGSDDTFTTQELDKIKLALDRQGTIPLSVSRDGGQETYHYGVVISEVDEFNLRGDDRYLEAVKMAQMRSDKNPIFIGRPVEWNGLLIFTLRGVKAAGCIQGTPLRPECAVYGSLTADATTVTVGGAAETATGQQKQFTQFFGTTGTLKIGDEEIEYTGKTYRTFTGCTRGANSTTAETHSDGDLVTQRDTSKVLAFGAEILAFGWGQHPARVEDKDDYGFITGIGIETLYGVKAIEDSAGDKPNYLVMEAYSGNPGTI
jgi:N4-gp56 family major capsid protein